MAALQVILLAAIDYGSVDLLRVLLLVCAMASVASSTRGEVSPHIFTASGPTSAN